ILHISCSPCGVLLPVFVSWFDPPGQGSQTKSPSSSSPSSSLSPCSETQVTEFIQQFVDTCLLVSDSNTELSYVLPSESVKKGCFERLFQALEQSLTGLALTSFGVMDTTLEEVFLKVCEVDQSLDNSDAVGSGAQDGLAPETGPSLHSEESEVELSNLVQCSRLSQSQVSLKSSSSVGSVRGDEGGPYADFYGDYCPLFENGQESDSASLRGQLKFCLTVEGSRDGRRKLSTRHPIVVVFLWGFFALKRTNQRVRFPE
uniref:Uncharacterized protein n=1 Tax=Xiphophorus couchianus TaxID=32473 RepID=A0A3B5LII2_9TELE